MVANFRSFVYIVYIIYIQYLCIYPILQGGLLKMNSTEKAPSLTPIRRWVTYLGIFLLVQVILILVDGTSLEPNINDSDSFIPKTFRSILDSSLFTEWITPYSYPFFNMVMTVHIIALLIVAITEIVGRLIFKK